ncbi:MAG: LysM peptidoglycan-binding domain-containing protein [Bacteroidales bacterium]|nr:LysM peptidoglycan-binding domain-containing protein [Bacteroidales bacterium]
MRKSIFLLFLLLAIGLSAMAETYIVDRGDTLDSIAQKFGITRTQIVELNPDAGQFIYVGMELTLPDGAHAVTPTQSSSSQGASTQVASTPSYQNQSPQYSESSDDSSDQKWGAFLQFGLGFISHESEHDRTTYTSARLDVTSFTATINGFYNFYQGAKVILGVGYRSTRTYMSATQIGSWGDAEQNDHFLTVPLGLGYTIGSISKLGITPIANFDFNIGLKSTRKNSQNGESVETPKLKAPKTCVDFQLGAHIHLWGFGIFGGYHFPVNKYQKAYFGEDGYFEVGMSCWFNL